MKFITKLYDYFITDLSNWLSTISQKHHEKKIRVIKIAESRDSVNEKKD